MTDDLWRAALGGFVFVSAAIVVFAAALRVLS